MSGTSVAGVASNRTVREVRSPRRSARSRRVGARRAGCGGRLPSRWAMCVAAWPKARARSECRGRRRMPRTRRGGRAGSIGAGTHQIVTPPLVAPRPAISPVTALWDWLISPLPAWFPGSERVSAAADQGCRSSLYRAEPPRHAPRTRCGERGTRVAAISRCHQTTPEAFCTRRSTSRSMRSDGGYRG